MAVLEKLAIACVIAASSVIALAVCAPREAHAQRSPDTATLDRGDGVSRIGIDFGLTLMDEPPAPYDAVLRIEPYGQYITHSGFGIYGAIPIANSFGDGNASEPEPTLAVGNLDVGALFVASGPTTSLVFRGGVAIPTAGDDRDDIPTNFYGSVPRITDVALAEPDAVYARVAFSPLIHTSNIFLRFDVGFDLGIDTDDNDNDPEHYLRLNVGGGVDLDVLAVGVELVNLLPFDDDDDNDRAIHNIALTLRFMGEALQPVIAVGTPLDDGPRDNIDAFVMFGIQVVP